MPLPPSQRMACVLPPGSGCRRPAPSLTSTAWAGPARFTWRVEEGIPRRKQRTRFLESPGGKRKTGRGPARWSPRTNNQRPTTRNQHQETNNQKPTMPRLRAGHLAVAIQRDHRSSEGLPDALARLLPRKRGRSHRGADVSVSEQALEPGQIAGRGFDVPSTPRQTAEFVDKEHCRPGLLLVVRGDSLRGRQGTSAFVRRRELAVSR
jgi:hypothetical protein